MHVSQIAITNFRKFRYFETELKPFTLLIGENNTGKTNLLHAIGLVLSNDISFYHQRRLEYEDINNQAINEFKRQLIDFSVNVADVVFPEVCVRLVFQEFTDDQKAVVGDWFINAELTQAALQYCFRHRSPKRNEWIVEQRVKIAALVKQVDETDAQFMTRKIAAVDFPIKDYDYIIFGGDDSTRQADNYYSRMLGFELLDALRDAKRELVAIDKHRLLYRVLSNRDESKFADLRNELALLDEKVDGNVELKSIKNAIGTYLNKISLCDNDSDNTVDFSFSCVETSELLKKLSLIYGSEPVNVLRNGLGRNNLLYIALVLSHLYDTGNIYSHREFRLIGIEEPESHLHPDLQEHLAKNIKQEVSPSSQIILTSHSPHIVSKMALDNIQVIYTDTNNVLQHHWVLTGFNDTAENRRIVRYLEKYLDATKSTMFFSRHLLLVEGISEQLIVPRLFAAYFGVEMAKKKTCIINVQGLAFKEFLTVIRNGYFIKCAVLTDSDEGTRTENRADGLRAEFNGCTSISINVTTYSTFEKDLVCSNLSGTGRELLLNAIKETRPQVGREYAEGLGENNIDVEAFFALIADYKSEFAYNVVQFLIDTPKALVIPPYIRTAFDHLHGRPQE